MGRENKSNTNTNILRKYLTLKNLVWRRFPCEGIDENEEGIVDKISFCWKYAKNI